MIAFVAVVSVCQEIYCSKDVLLCFLVFCIIYFVGCGLPNCSKVGVATYLVGAWDAVSGASTVSVQCGIETILFK